MNLNETAKKLRMLLYGKKDCEELCEDFEETLRTCGCDEFTVTVVENSKVLMVDAYPCIQYIKEKRPGNKIYQVIPKGSPLENKHGKRTKTYAKKTYQERRFRQSA